MPPQGTPSDISDAIFARRLRQVREAARLTQQELADVMASTGNKIHRSTVGKIENGERPVTVGEAVQLAGILGVPLMDLVTERCADSESEQVRRARIRAQAHVRALQHDMAKHAEQLASTQALYGAAEAKLRAAQRDLARLGGALPLEG